MLEPTPVARDENGWPQAWWSLAGADPEFDFGDRDLAHERLSVAAEEGSDIMMAEIPWPGHSRAAQAPAHRRWDATALRTIHEEGQDGLMNSPG